MISKEDMEFLDGYAGSFKTAVENNYCRNLGIKKYNELHLIYQRITGKKYAVNWGCPHCAIRFVQTLAKIYFEEKKRLEAEQVQNELEPKDVTASAPKRKPGRPKKTATNNDTKTE